MATKQDLINLAKARIKSVNILIKAKDWDMAGYLMGYVFECYLKAAVCSTLKIDKYPDDIKKDDQMRAFFLSHSFDRLVLISGMTRIFQGGTNKGASEILNNWSLFSFHYQQNWTETRYRSGFWNEKNVKVAYNCLLDRPYGLLYQLKIHLR